MPSRNRSSRAGLTLIELIAIIFLLVILAMVFLPALARQREVEPRASCPSNLKQMGIVFKMYSYESHGEYLPPIHAWEETPIDCYLADLPEAGDPAVVKMLMPNLRSVYPQYLTDLYIVACPSDINTYRYPDTYSPYNPIPYCTDPSKGLAGYDNSYVYLGWLFDEVNMNSRRETMDLEHLPGTAPKQLTAVLRGLESAPNPARFVDSDLIVEAGLGNTKSDRIYRLREGIERVLITDTSDPEASAKALSRIPIMMDRLSITPEGVAGNHFPVAANVLFLDGHVELQELDSTSPTTSGVARALTLAPGG